MILAVAQSMPVLLEAGKKLTFAVAVDWPGWARSGKGEEAALARLLEYAPRYAPIAKAAGLELPQDPRIEVAERLPGDASTDFGVPASIADLDRRPLSGTEAARTAGLMWAAWAAFDGVVAAAPEELRKGPRGGGRDRDKIWRHVVEAEATAYAPRLGLKLKAPVAGDGEGLQAMRQAVIEGLTAGTAEGARRWPPRYAARRIAWHVLDHLWEIEDRSR